MKRSLTLLRITFWWGIIADALETVRMLVPGLFIQSTGAAVSRNPGFDFALMYGAPVMLGWTLLLIWAERRPMERKGVLLCLIPVVISYFALEVFAVKTGILPFETTLPTFILQSVFLGLIVLSYFMARSAERRNDQ